MKKIYTILLIAFSLNSFAQINVNSSDFGIVGDSIFLAVNNNPAANISVGGTGQQTWDFSSIGFGGLDTISFINPQFTGFSSLFPMATEATGKDDGLTYFNNNPAFRAIDGQTGDLFGDGNNYAINYSPDLTILNFPATYLDSFLVSTSIDTIKDTSIVIPPLFNFDSIRLKRTIIYDSKIDGYGLITTPGGTFNSIRQYRIETQIDTIWTHTTGGSWALAPVNATATATVHKYIWYTNFEKYQVFEAEASGPGGNITTAKFLLGGNMSASIAVFQGPNCFNGCDGFAIVDAVGGTQPYTYKWSSNSGNQTNDTASALCAGLYNVTVYDVLGDSATSLINLNQPSTALQIDTNSITAESAFGNDGAIDVNVFGGTSPYSYLWSNAAISQDISGLATGNFSLLATDANGCTDSLSFFVPNAASALTASASVLQQATCFNACNGEAKVSAAGGVLPYSYKWSNAQTDTIGSSLCAGSFSVTVYDATMDSTVTSGSITQPTVLVADTVSVSSETPSGNDGSINISVIGGTAPYNYLWSNSDTTKDVFGLTTGNFSVTVTDGNNCTDVLTVFVPFSGTSQGITYFSSDFGSAGDAAYLAFDPSIPNVDITSNGSTNWNFGNLQIGNLDTIKFLDPANTVNGSKFPNSNLVIARKNDTSYVNKSPTSLTFQGIVADAFGLGGVAAIQFNPPLKDIEFPIAFGQNFTSTTVIDSSLDTAVQIFDSIRVKRIITQSSQTDAYGNMIIPAGNYDAVRQRTLQVSMDSIWGHTILGWQNIPQLNTTDSLYIFRWYAKGEAFPIVVVEAGDSVGSITSVAFKLGDNLLASIASKTNVTCNGDCDGEATVQGLSGVGPYNYYWDANTGNQTGATATNLCPNSYAVTVVDANMDSVLTTVQITEPLVLIVTLNSTTPESDPGNNGAININVTGGTSPYQYAWSNTSKTTQDLTGLVGGNYTVTVTDANNCTQTLPVTLNSTVGVGEISKEDFQLFPNPTNGILNLVFGNSNSRKIEILDVLGSVVFESNTSQKQETLDLANLEKGMYLISISDQEGNKLLRRLILH